METLAKQREALQDDLSVETTDVFYSTALLNRYINRAHRAIANLYPWQETQQALKRSTIAGQEYVSYPENLRTDSVFLIRVDGVEYKILTFREYQRFKEENPNTQEKRVSDWRRKLFINPTPATDGTGNIEVWGHEVPDTLVDDGDFIVFAHQSTLEEAINMYAKGLALMKAKGSYFERGKGLMGDALSMAQNEWRTQQKRQAEYQTESTTMWEHTDLLNETGDERQRGNFRTY